MESILAAIPTLTILGGITAWAFAYKINRDRVEFYRRISDEREANPTEGQTLAAIAAMCRKMEKTEDGCLNCRFCSLDGCRIEGQPTDWKV